MKKFTYLLLGIFLMAIASCTPQEKPADKSLEKISIEPAELTLAVGATETLKANLFPQEAQAQIEWKTTAPTIVSVENGVITALADGTATIIAYSGNIEGKCIVTVKPDAATVEISKTELSIPEGEKAQLEATIKPEGATQTIEWKTSDPEVATVDQSGLVTAIKMGQCDIIAAAGDKASATCKVTVTSSVNIEIKIHGAEGLKVDSIEYIPSDPEFRYMVSCSYQDIFDEWMATGGEEEVIKQDLEWYKFLADYYGMTLGEAVDKLLESGTQTFLQEDLISMLDWDCGYVFYAYGLTPELEKTSKIFSEVVHTAAPVPSDMTFEVEFIDISKPNDVTFKVIPSKDNETYFVTAQKQSFVDAYVNQNLEQEMIRKLYYANDPRNYHVGVEEEISLYIGGLNTDYCVIIFGFENGPTTPVFYFPFKSAGN